MNYTNVVFDVDRTLFDTEKIVPGDLVESFEGIRDLLQELTKRGIAIGAITSGTRQEYESGMSSLGLSGCFKEAVCREDTVAHKPNPEPMKRYLEFTGAKPEKVLYVGASRDDMECAGGAGIDFALALWACSSVKHIRADHYLPEPYDVLHMLDQLDNLRDENSWLDLAMELQFIAQAGLTYSKDCFDIERFERVRELPS